VSYVVMMQLKHNGDTYKEGDEIFLSQKEADFLLSALVIEPLQPILPETE
jgi:hypothetical protein